MTAEANGNGKANGRKPKDRKARVETRQVLVLTVDGEEFRYLLDRVTSDYGAAFKLTKLPPELPAYHVCIDDKLGKAHTCECLGYLRWGRDCKHVRSLQALLKAGKLAGVATR